MVPHILERNSSVGSGVMLAFEPNRQQGAALVAKVLGSTFGVDVVMTVTLTYSRDRLS